MTSPATPTMTAKNTTATTTFKSNGALGFRTGAGPTAGVTPVSTSRFTWADEGTDAPVPELTEEAGSSTRGGRTADVTGIAPVSTGDGVAVLTGTRVPAGVCWMATVGLAPGGTV